MIAIKAECVWCHRVEEFNVTEAAFDKWKYGAFVQDAFPGLSADDRELLISGTCSLCSGRYVWGLR